MAIDRGAMREQLAKRQAEQQAAKDGEGSDLYEPYFTMPNGVSKYVVKPTPTGIDVGMDIIPFVVGSKYPTNNRYGLSKGSLTYVLDVWRHENVGPTKKGVVCPLKNYGLPCPLCEKKAELLAERGRMEKEEFRKWAKEHDELTPKRRVIYNVIIRSDAKEEAKGIQIFESSYMYAEEKYQEKAEAAKKRGGGEVLFASPDQGDNLGQTIWINYKLQGEYEWKVGAADFVKRNYDITDEEIESATKLDEMLVIYEYDEIVKIMGMGSVNQAQEEPEDDTPEPPVTNRRTLASAPVEPEPTPEPAMEDDVPMELKGDTPLECPFNAVFGKEFDEYQECDNCDIRIDCQAEKEKMEAPKKPINRKPSKK